MNLVKLFAVLQTLLKVGFAISTFHVRFVSVTFLENLYIMTALLSGCYLQCLCIVPPVYNNPVLVVPKVAII